MIAYEIPLSPEAQKLSVDLAGKTYALTLTWCKNSNTWTLNIADQNEIPIISGIPLVANVDLLAPFPYLNFGGQLIARTDNAPLVPPTYDNLGITGHLYFITP